MDELARDTELRLATLQATDPQDADSMTQPNARMQPRADSSPQPGAAHPLHGRHVWMIGIGGSGMSGLAFLLAQRGAHCSGTDAEPSALTDALNAAGIACSCGELGPLAATTELVIRSAAVKDSHPQVQEARRRGLLILSYAEALGWCMSGRTGVSIAGTHGKSTTTAMLAWVLAEAGLDPSLIVGATVSQLGGGFRTGSAHIPAGALIGQPGIMVAEACEYDRSFHHHRPTMALINNVEEDHLDCYGSLDEIVGAFREFARLLPPAAAGGRLLIAEQGAHRRAVASDLACSVSTFGWAPGADYRVDFDAESNCVRVRRKGQTELNWKMRLRGDHNALNSAAAGILALWLGAPRRSVESALESFAGCDRRLQFLGSCTAPDGGTVRVFDDYAHHPTEIEKTLVAMRQSERPTRLICIFQPHQHSRTRFLLEQFAQSFSQASIVLVPDIYFVRDSEAERALVCSADLVERLRARGVVAESLDPFSRVVDWLQTNCRGGDVVVSMGAGPVWMVSHEFLARSAAGLIAVSAPGAQAAA